MAAFILSGRATPLPAMSKAVPWAGSADNRQTDGHINRTVKRQHLDRNQPLVVIHRHHAVILARTAWIKHESAGTALRS